jgi:glutathione reductase (NADPH)
MTETETKRRYGKRNVCKSSFRILLDTLPGPSEYAFMKLVMEHGGRRIIGAHVEGNHTAEII